MSERLLRKPPAGRSPQQLRRHFDVERALASEIRAATAAERPELYRSLYPRLFAAVPDHPRLVRRGSPEATSRANRSRWSLLSRHVDESSTVLEIGPGDCLFARDVATRTRRVLGLDISDQRTPGEAWPRNLSLQLYDGRECPDLAEGEFDVVFSDQILEHIHPDDIPLHFSLAHRALRVEGCYLLRTPHRLSGPHDVSRYFSDEPKGFHLQEWTIRQIASEANDCGFDLETAYWQARSIVIRPPLAYFRIVEKVLSPLPVRRRRGAATLMIPSVAVVLRRRA